MSRSYQMDLLVEGLRPERVEAIKEAASGEWPFEDALWLASEGLQGFGDGSLCGGESVEAFVDRIAQAVWRANGEYCQVEVRATYLEDLPSEHHGRFEDDYARLAIPHEQQEE